MRDLLVYFAIAGAFLIPAMLIPIDGVTRLLVSAGLVALLLYEPVMVTAAGGTIGHRSLNLRVVRASDFGRVPIHRSVIRVVVKAVLGVPVFLAVYFTSKNQGLHDLAAGTVVIPSGSADIGRGGFDTEHEKRITGGLRPWAVGAGLLAYFTGNVLLGGGYAIARLWLSTPEDLSADQFLYTSVDYLIIVLFGLVLVTGGGYVAGRLAGARQLAHAACVGIVVCALFVLVELREPDPTAPVWFSLAFLSGAVPATALGGWLARRHV